MCASGYMFANTVRQCLDILYISNLTRLVSDLIITAEEVWTRENTIRHFLTKAQVANDVNLWLPQGEAGFLAMGWFFF